MRDFSFSFETNLNFCLKKKTLNIEFKIHKKNFLANFMKRLFSPVVSPLLFDLHNVTAALSYSLIVHP